MKLPDRIWRAWIAIESPKPMTVPVFARSTMAEGQQIQMQFPLRPELEAISRGFLYHREVGMQELKTALTPISGRFPIPDRAICLNPVPYVVKKGNGVPVGLEIDRDGRFNAQKAPPGVLLKCTVQHEEVISATQAPIESICVFVVAPDQILRCQNCSLVKERSTAKKLVLQQGDWERNSLNLGSFSK